MSSQSGQCLCGNVKVAAQGKMTHASACHCTMCRQQNGGGAFHGAIFENGVTVSGDALKWYASSPYGERGFCSSCGTTIAWRMQGEDTEMSLALGLFDSKILEMMNVKIGSRIFADEAGSYADLPQDVPHMTAAETFAYFEKMMAEKANDL